MNLELTGKTALVTASTGGIGLAITKALHREGAEVIVNGRTGARVSDAIGRIKEGESRVSGIAADLTTREGMAKVLESVPRVDILVNNLGVYEAKPLEALKDDDWLKMFETNVLTGARISPFYLKGMKDRNWGRILFIASEAGVNIPADMMPYGVSKAAQIALARGLAETTVGTGVTVNSVLPGPTYSEGINSFLDSVVKDSGDRAESEREFLKKARPTSLIQRFATAEEVANLVVYLASPLSSATNGAALRVEGGLLRGII
jgi:NAD(P)-dependent dehydrogenase (short-subunit alcohol dehydrogenase family)